MLPYLFSNPWLLIMWLGSLAVAVTVHEFAHAWTAERLGDPTARLAGRLTLNPLAHLDPLGTLCLLFFMFGWGKPVPFDPYNLADPRRDGAVISLAGPVSNLMLATVLAVVFHVFALIAPAALLTLLIKPLIELNVTLAIFNFLPIHPLDGGKILAGLLPEDLARRWDEVLNQFGILLLVLLILPLGSGSLAGYIITPVINVVLSVLGLGSGGVV